MDEKRQRRETASPRTVLYPEAFSEVTETLGQKTPPTNLSAMRAKGVFRVASFGAATWEPFPPTIATGLPVVTDAGTHEIRFEYSLD
jgi:hypothetical protein